MQLSGKKAFEIDNGNGRAYKLESNRKWLFSTISALGSDFNPRNTFMYSCG